MPATDRETCGGCSCMHARMLAHACRYFVVYFGDCTLGLGLAITFHKLVTGAALHYFSKLSEKESDKVPWWEPLVEIGNYGDPPLLRRWLIQVVFWVTCVVTARSIVGVVVISSIPVLQQLTQALDRKFEGHPDLYIFTVMVGIPIFINVGQAWIQDQVLKWKIRKKPKAGHPDEPAIMLSLQQADVIIGTPGRRNK
jgi:hypothetical protein